MLENTKHRDEEHVDERARQFFQWGYSGDGNSYHWNSLAKGLKPTLTLESRLGNYCGYCGRRALPIQGEKGDLYSRDKKYFSKGHCCVCRDAMDELEIEHQKEQLIDKMNQALSQLNSVKPEVNHEVMTSLVQAEAEQKIKEIHQARSRSHFWPPSNTGIKIVKGGEKTTEDSYDE